MRVGWVGATVASTGRCVNHEAPSDVRRLDVKVRGEAVRLDTSTSCALGAESPAFAVKISPDGLTTGPGSLPAGNTRRRIETSCGLLTAVAEVTVTTP